MGFMKIAITWPECFVGEGREIVRLLDEGFDRVHIRKPEAGIAEVAALIESIPAAYRERLSLHDHLFLAEAYGLGGVHLNRRNPVAPIGWRGLVSRSLHSLDEIGLQQYDYAFLSSMFASISKPGYEAKWDEGKLRRCVDSKIIALGGVTPARFSWLANVGFGGAAMLGELWRKPSFCLDFRLQYITHLSEAYDYGCQAEMALRGGCRWVQIRRKDASMDRLDADIRAVAPLCRQYRATVIIDDRADLVNRYGLDGVHLGKNDMAVAEARRLIGPRKIIGATANCFADIERAAAEGADYIGLGPFRFTTTKQRLSPVLGVDGYRRIVAETRRAGISLPIVVIGGITEADIPGIMATGVGGVAISSTILRAVDPAEKTESIIKTIEQCQN